MPQITFRAMGCQMLAALDVETPEAADALAQVPAWFAEWEQHLSRFREDSELSQLNQSQGQAVAVSPVLWEVIALALQAARESAGLVTPTLLAALEAAGYSQSFETLANLPGSAMAQAPIALPAEHAVERDPERRTIRLRGGARLDLGGVAKGWAADLAARQLSTHGPALVDAGGDIAVSGPMTNGEHWTVGVADPFCPEEDVELLLVERGGVATSGRDYRRWQRAGTWYHHLLDPRTSQPAETDVLSATVIAPNTHRAEVAAKVALILGSQAGLAWLEARPELAGLLILEDGRMLRSRRLEAYQWSD